jgi:hypothetical protein
MKRTQKFTHQGWFGICPVYVGELESEAPHITPRTENAFYEFLFTVSHYAFMAFFTVTDILLPAWQPGFPIYITSELLVPHLYEYDE